LFYASYGAHKNYSGPGLSAKDIRRFDAEIWRPAAFHNELRVLEVECGTGAFLAYLNSKDVSAFLGIDHDPRVGEVLPPEVGAHFQCGDAFDIPKAAPKGSYDRVVLLDVLEHFSPAEGVALLTEIGRLLAPGGKIVAKVPNWASPWGLNYQFGDLTRRTGSTPSAWANWRWRPATGWNASTTSGAGLGAR
jgi:SAM-dependent methyltransferase